MPKVTQLVRGRAETLIQDLNNLCSRSIQEPKNETHVSPGSPRAHFFTKKTARKEQQRLEVFVYLVGEERSE